MVLYSPDWSNIGFSFIFLTVNLFNHPTLIENGLYWVIFQAFLLFADFFQNQLFLKTLSGIPSECQTVWIQIRPDALSGLIWVQIVCKCYQQITPVGISFEHPKHTLKLIRWVKIYLGDNCIQNFHLGRYILGYTVGNLVLRRRASGDVKRYFRTYIRRYTSPKENVE